MDAAILVAQVSRLVASYAAIHLRGASAGGRGVNDRRAFVALGATDRRAVGNWRSGDRAGLHAAYGSRRRTGAADFSC